MHGQDAIDALAEIDAEVTRARRQFTNMSENKIEAALRKARAAIEASPWTGGPPSGFSLIPTRALMWLMGEGPDHDGLWFGEESTDYGRARPNYKNKFWWRTSFRAVWGHFAAAQMPPPPPEDPICDVAAADFITRRAERHMQCADAL